MPFDPVITPQTIQVGQDFYDLGGIEREQIDLPQLLRRLAGIPRFQGQTVIRRHLPLDGLDTVRHFTVLHHTHAVLALLNAAGQTPEKAPALTIAAALHDGAEAFTGDISAPFRRTLEPQALEDAEGPLVTAVMLAGGLTEAESWHWREHPQLKAADSQATYAEAAEFFAMAPGYRDWWEQQCGRNARHFVRQAAARSDAELLGAVLETIGTARACLPAWRAATTPPERGE